MQEGCRRVAGGLLEECHEWHGVALPARQKEVGVDLVWARVRVRVRIRVRVRVRVRVSVRARGGLGLGC